MVELDRRSFLACSIIFKYAKEHTISKSLGVKITTTILTNLTAARRLKVFFNHTLGTFLVTISDSIC